MPTSQQEIERVPDGIVASRYKIAGVGLEYIPPKELFQLDEWKKFFDPNSAWAVDNIGAPLFMELNRMSPKEGLFGDRMTQEGWKNHNRLLTLGAAEALKMVQKEVEKTATSLEKSNDRNDFDLWTVAYQGRLRETEARLEGKKITNKIRIIKAVSLIANYVSKGYGQSRYPKSLEEDKRVEKDDLIGTAAIYLARVIAKKFVKKYPEMYRYVDSLPPEA